MAYMDLNYERISDQLKLTEMSQIIVKSFGGEADPEKLERDRFFYLYLRTLAGIERLAERDRKYKEHFWKDFIEYSTLYFDRYVKTFGGVGNLYTISLELLTFTGDYSLRGIELLLPEGAPQKYIRDNPVCDCTVHAAIDIVKSFAEHDGRAEAGNFMRAFFSFAKQRSSDSEAYANLIVQILAETYMQPDLSSDIIAEGERFFRKHENSQERHNYLWLRHCYAQRIGKRDQAKDALVECIQIRKGLFGMGTWATDYPISRYYLLFSLTGNGNDPFGKSKEELAFVERFLDHAQRNIYGNWQDPQARMAAGDLIGILLQSVYLKHDLLPEHKDLIAVYSSLCDEFDNDPNTDILKTENAKFVESSCQFQENDWIHAEQMISEGLNKTDGMVSKIHPPYVHKINLVSTYLRQSDYDHARPLITELLDELDQNDPKQRRYWCLAMDSWITVSTQTGYEKDSLNLYRILRKYVLSIDSVIRNLKDAEHFTMEEEETFFLIDAIVFVTAFPQSLPGKSLLKDCLNILRFIESNKRNFMSRKRLETALYIDIGYLLCRIGDREAVVYAGKAAQELRNQPDFAVFATPIRVMCIEILMAFGETREARVLLDELLSAITETWHASVRYYNDARLEAFLTPAENDYHCVRLFINKLYSVRETYGFVLKYKSLASLAGRERNRFLRNRPESTELIRKIGRLQDRIAEEELDAIIHENDPELSKVRGKLRELEAELAGMIPTDLDFIDINLERVTSAMPDNCAVIEYQVYTAQSEPALLLNGMMEYPVYVDTYLILKRDGAVKIEKTTLPNSNTLLAKAEMVADVFRRESLNRNDPAAPTAKEFSARDEALALLYDKLILPFRDKLAPFTTLYIAPDQALNAVPFEILRAGQTSKARLSDDFSVIRIDSARDFLFGNEQPDGKEALVLGNPKYDARSDGEATTGRLAGIQANSVKQLPFSEFEAERVADICDTKAVVGAQALKSVLTDKANYGLIHLATHGFFDTTLENNAVYSSFLLFAGAKSWINDNIIDPVYGNGIITADEISRLDLRGVKLVVLSACFSGMTDPVVTQNLRGLLGGFAAAGVQYVVTHQWSADDVATAVLMIYFYDCYIRQKRSPADALAQAKSLLRRTTIGDLKAMGVIQYGLSHSPDAKSRAVFERFERRPVTTKPFESEYYWGGFSCHRCW